MTLDSTAPSSVPSDLTELADHLRSHAVLTEGPYRLASGKVSSWYLDARRTSFSGKGAQLVGAAILDRLEPVTVAVGGMTMGADPLAVATCVVATYQGRSLDAFSVRKKSKDHGVSGRIVGPVSAGDRATVLEDTTTTGRTLLEAIRVGTEFGLEIVGALVLVDRSDGVVRPLLEAEGVPYQFLFTPADFGMG